MPDPFNEDIRKAMIKAAQKLGIRSGGRYVMRNGSPVLMERTGYDPKNEGD